jgi:RNA polymerase sigma factor (sigma-70 family)
MADPYLMTVLRHLRGLAGTNHDGDRSDSHLLQQFVARRDEDAFSALLRRHGPLVLGVCRQVLRNVHDAEDVFQATFLVLARKAASIRTHEALGAWLYRVALNLARTARAGTAQRRTWERRAATMPSAQSAEESPSSDWQPLLHEEVNRLPEKYRVPVVLCYLKGQTHAQAARQLGWPVGTVKGRLARARHLLRTRLARRGVTLSAGGLAGVWSSGPVSAAVPAALLDTTLKTVLLFTAGQTLAATAIAARAVFLAQGALKTMAATRWTLVAWLLLTLGAMGVGGGLLAVYTQGGERPGDRPGPPPGSGDEQTLPGPLAFAEVPQPRPNPRRRADRLPIDQAIVHRVEQKESDKYAGAAVVIENPPVLDKPPREEVKALRHLLNKAVASGDQANVEVQAGSKLNILAIGPMLYAPDRVAVQGLVRRPGLLEMDVFYTRTDSVKARGYWHPLIQVPVDLAPGPYELSVIWRQVESLPDGKLRNQYAVHTFDFAVVERNRERTALPRGASARFRLGSTVSSVVYFPDGKTLVAGGHVGMIHDGEQSAGRVRVWDVATGKQLEQFYAQGVAHVAVSPDGKTLAFAGVADGRISLWDVAGRNWLAQLPGRRGWGGNLPLAFSPDGKTLVAGGDPELAIWDVATRKVVRRNIPEGEPVYKLAFSPDSRILAFSCVDLAPLRLMEVATWKELPPFRGQRRDVKVAAFAPDGKSLARQEEDHSISLCDLASGKELRRFKGHTATVTTLAFSPSGRTLASGGADQTIRFWEVATGKELGQLWGHQDTVTSLTWKADGKSLASGSEDGTVVIWDTAEKIRSDRP